MALSVANPLAGVLGMAVSDTSRLRGSHAPRVLVSLREAAGLHEWVYETSEMLAPLRRYQRGRPEAGGGFQARIEKYSRSK